MRSLSLGAMAWVQSYLEGPDMTRSDRRGNITGRRIVDDDDDDDKDEAEDEAEAEACISMTTSERSDREQRKGPNAPGVSVCALIPWPGRYSLAVTWSKVQPEEDSVGTGGTGEVPDT